MMKKNYFASRKHKELKYIHVQPTPEIDYNEELFLSLKFKNRLRSSFENFKGIFEAKVCLK